MSKKKNKGGRPTKLTKELLKTLEEVIEENILVCTDEELVFVINEALPEEARIGLRTFEQYKAKALKGEDLDPIYSEFLRLIKKALLKEKKSLLNKLEKGKSGQWQKYAWILERKFKEYNLKHIVESDVTTKGESINDRPLKTLPTDKLEKIEDLLKDENLNDN